MNGVAAVEAVWIMVAENFNLRGVRLPGALNAMRCNRAAAVENFKEAKPCSHCTSFFLFLPYFWLDPKVTKSQG